MVNLYKLEGMGAPQLIYMQNCCSVVHTDEHGAVTEVGVPESESAQTSHELQLIDMVKLISQHPMAIGPVRQVSD